MDFMRTGVEVGCHSGRSDKIDRLNQKKPTEFYGLFKEFHRQKWVSWTYFFFPTHLQPLGFLPRISCDLQLARPKCLCTERLMEPRWFLGKQLVCGCVSNRQMNKMWRRAFMGSVHKPLASLHHPRQLLKKSDFECQVRLHVPLWFSWLYSLYSSTVNTIKHKTWTWYFWFCQTRVTSVWQHSKMFFVGWWEINWKFPWFVLELNNVTREVSVYASIFPHRTYRLVMDGVVLPTPDDPEHLQSQFLWLVNQHGWTFHPFNRDSHVEIEGL